MIFSLILSSTPFDKCFETSSITLFFIVKSYAKSSTTLFICFSLYTWTSIFYSTSQIPIRSAICLLSKRLVNSFSSQPHISWLMLLDKGQKHVLPIHNPAGGIPWKRTSSHYTFFINMCIIMPISICLMSQFFIYYHLCITLQTEKQKPRRTQCHAHQNERDREEKHNSEFYIIFQLLFTDFSKKRLWLFSSLQLPPYYDPIFFHSYQPSFYCELYHTDIYK